MKTLLEHNETQKRMAAERWRMVLELSKTMSQSEIALRLNLSRSRVNQMLKQAKGQHEHSTP